ncbi:MAG: hypothetical protein HRU26_13565 [Psychroserpens sp.]|nr:hypothetical protein [Psychroserpens sp.]
MLFWVIGVIVISIAAFIIIKLSVDTNKNNDSSLGILEHPSTFEKQPIEYVEKSLDKDSNHVHGDQHE